MTDANPNWTVYSSPISGLVQAVEMLGCDSDKLLSVVGIDRKALLEPERRFSFASLLELYRLSAQRTANEDIGLYSGRIAYINGLNLQLYMASICKTFREYLNLIPSVLRFAGDIGEIKIQREGDYIRLEWLPLWHETSKQRFLSDEMLATAAYIVNSLCVQPIPVIKACFTYSEPKDCRLLRTVFGPDLSFEQPVSCLYFSRDCLDYPLTQLESSWGQALSQSIQHLFDGQENPDDFMNHLKEVVLQLLPAGEMHVDRVASQMNISRRTLQRRLAERETQFQQVLQELRSDLAIQYLSDKRLSITDIAFLLGYADQGSFSGAFKARHGMAPSEYRLR